MNVWIHVYHHILLHCHLVVPLFDSILHPFGKLLASYGIGDVHYPLLGQLEPLFLDRQVVYDLWIVLKELTDVLQEESFVPDRMSR